MPVDGVQPACDTGLALCASASGDAHLPSFELGFEKGG